ncbi:MAG: YesL family protein, partial [Lachnospiraceae bacterium]|nr:YesL family protein [Lachnospiraceae bacterium]
MKGFFSYDSAFFRALDKLGSLFILNMLTLVCSIPLFTIGASFTALYYVTMKMVRDEETYITKDYFRSFRQNFRQGTVIWLILFIFSSVLFFDYRFMALNRDRFAAAGAFMILTMACAVFLLIEASYVFPVLAKFYNTVGQTMKNAVFMGIRHFPKTMAIIFIDVIFLVITLIALYRNGRSFLAPLYVCLGLAVPAYANSYIFVKIFDQYIPADESAGTGSEEEYLSGLQ